jgi:tetratricopeptide (TPR) repeat protein
MSNLGNVLSTLGERENDANLLREAIATYREALKEYPRGRNPLDWAMTQNNLGNALARLGERDNGIGRMAEAVQSYRDALTECTRERAPMQWAMTQNNLGGALLRLGERANSTVDFEAAIASYNEALGVFVAASAVYYVEACWENRDRAITLLAERNGFVTPPAPPFPKSPSEFAELLSSRGI